MPTYGTYTWNIIESLRESAVTLTQEGDTLHLQAEDIDIKLDSQGTLASRIMEQLKVEGLSWRDLAERLSTAATTLTNVRKNRRTAPWELAARIILLIGKLPTPEQADHMFMEMRLPGLYTDTYSAIINRRNHVIRRILEYGQSHPCPCSNWLEFTLCVMHRLDLPFCPEIRFHTPDLSSETLEQIRQWQQEAAALRYCDYSKKRKLYLEAYREAHGMKGHGGLSEALQKISDDHYIGIGSVQHFFRQFLQHQHQVRPQHHHLHRRGVGLHCEPDQ